MNYLAVFEVAKLYHIEMTPNLFAKIRVLEREYLKLQAKDEKQDKKK